MSEYECFRCLQFHHCSELEEYGDELLCPSCLEKALGIDRFVEMEAESK